MLRADLRDLSDRGEGSPDRSQKVRFEVVGQPALRGQLLEVRPQREGCRGTQAAGASLQASRSSSSSLRAPASSASRRSRSRSRRCSRYSFSFARGIPRRRARGRGRSRPGRARAAPGATRGSGRASPRPGEMNTLPSPITRSPGEARRPRSRRLTWSGEWPGVAITSKGPTSSPPCGKHDGHAAGMPRKRLAPLRSGPVGMREHDAARSRHPAARSTAWR